MSIVLGVAWLGSTFVNAHVAEIKDVAGALLADYPGCWLLFCSSLPPANFTLKAQQRLH
ncbi:hypothetical protein OK016_07850 [Vibrio chagasii]|nr:hypothetical protein [Vibrio chagasii]